MKIVIIGGVAAGMSAAAKAKRNMPEAEIVVYERSEIVSFGACGLPYYVGDFFQDENQMIARTAEQFSASGIEVKTKHDVLAVDVKQQQLEVRDIENNTTFTTKYDTLMIATGANAIIPPIENVKLENVFTLKSMEDGRALKTAAMSSDKKNVVVIGA
ncbi:MAG: FAD-dependent oxidoreductase, partial [Bacilli bacterium]